jgi:hypothetical protein
VLNYNFSMVTICTCLLAASLQQPLLSTRVLNASICFCIQLYDNMDLDEDFFCGTCNKSRVTTFSLYIFFRQMFKDIYWHIKCKLLWFRIQCHTATAFRLQNLWLSLILSLVATLSHTATYCLWIFQHGTLNKMEKPLARVLHCKIVFSRLHFVRLSR